MGANRNEQRVNRHRKRKKNVGELPHINSRPVVAPPEQHVDTSAEIGKCQFSGAAGQRGCVYGAGTPR
jgi:hypothetical protein